MRLATGPATKTAAEIAALREACRVARGALDVACAAVRPGVRTAAVDAAAEAFIRAAGATPEFLGYHGYPASTCISVNDEVVHGIPGERVIRDGDVVSVDVGARLDGWVGDNAATVLVGSVPERARVLSDTTRECLVRATEACRPGARLSDVGRAVQTLARSRGFAVVREYAGHGIGRLMHEDPQVHNHVSRETARDDVVIEPGLCIAIEPMLTSGRAAVRILRDGWTVVTRDGSLAAHWEDVVAVTDEGPMVLTRC